MPEHDAASLPDKFCKDCKHCPEKIIGCKGQCAKTWTDPRKGLPIRLGPVKARNYEWSCGASARGFEPTTNCQKVSRKLVAAAKPRRMKANLSERNLYHGKEHDENDTCRQGVACQPLDAAPPICTGCNSSPCCCDQIAQDQEMDAAPPVMCSSSMFGDMCQLLASHEGDHHGRRYRWPEKLREKAERLGIDAPEHCDDAHLPPPPEPQRPEPGDGWRLLVAGDCAVGTDEMWIGDHWEPIHGTLHGVKFYRRRVDPVAQDDEAYGDELLEQACDEAFEVCYSMPDKIVAALGRIVRQRLALQRSR